MLSLLTLNLQAAALPRAFRILDWLSRRDDHVIVLTETTNGPGTAHLLDRFRQAGFFSEHHRTADGDRGCALISRVPARPRWDLTRGISLPGRAVAITLDTRPEVTVVGIYVPSRDRAPVKVAKKRDFLTSVVDAVAAVTQHERRHLVLTGDYNVIARNHEPRYPAFQPFEYAFLDSLAELGLTDVHEHLNPGVQVHSWYGRGGNGYRFDYFHTGVGLTTKAINYGHVAEARTHGLSDHDGVALTLAVDIPGLLSTTAAAPAAAATLF